MRRLPLRNVVLDCADPRRLATFRVYADPAGHPLCMVRTDEDGPVT